MNDPTVNEPEFKVLERIYESETPASIACFDPFDEDVESVVERLKALNGKGLVLFDESIVGERHIELTQLGRLTVAVIKAWMDL